jgi:hypothetical protein
VTYKIFICILYNISYVEIGFADLHSIERNIERKDAPKGHLKKSEAIFQGDKRVSLTFSQQVGLGQVGFADRGEFFYSVQKEKSLFKQANKRII